jgi:hypothetical protein
MGKWLEKFSADRPESRTAKADTVREMGAMSGMSVRDIEVSAKITPPDETSTALQDAETIVIEPAAANPRPVYWERSDLSIVGPGRPEFLAKVGSGPKASYWVVAQFQGGPVWINSIVLRSKKAFEQQAKVRVVEPIPKDGF